MTRDEFEKNAVWAYAKNSRIECPIMKCEALKWIEGNGNRRWVKIRFLDGPREGEVESVSPGQLKYPWTLFEKDEEVRMVGLGLSKRLGTLPYVAEATW